jgi:virginiamycin B lyase
MTSSATRVFAFALAASLAACGGRSGYPTTLVPAAAPATNVARFAHHRGKVLATLRLVIGGLHRIRMHPSKRAPRFVSASTNGALAQVYPHGAARTPANLLAQVATDVSSGSKACGGKTGYPRTCTASLFAPPARALDIVISSYDQAPASGTIPGTAHLLGLGELDNEVLSAGKSNALSVFLGGVVDSLSGNPAFVSVPADNAVHDVAVAIDPADFGNNAITAGSKDPFANPISATLAESGGSGHASLVLDGGSPQSSATVAKSSDTLTLAYDGKSPAGYTVVLTLAAAAVNGTGGAMETMRLSPLALSSSNSDYTAKHLALRGNGDELTMTVAEADAPGPPTFTVTPSGCSSIADATPLSQSGTSGTFQVFADTMPSASGCTLLVSDGTSDISVDVTNSYVGVLGTPTITLYSSGITSGAQPQAIAVGPDGAMWFAEYNNHAIGRVTASGTPTINEYTLPTNNGTAYPVGIWHGPDGNMWWAGGNGLVGSITTSGTGTSYHTGSTSDGTAGMTLGPDGAMWFTEQFAAKIGRVTTAGSVTNEFSVTGSSGPQGIVAAPDGNLWFDETCFSHQAIAKMTTGGTKTEIGLSTSDLPDYLTLGPDGNLWFTTQSGGIGKFPTSGTSSSDATFYTSLNYQLPEYITTGPDGALWYTTQGTYNNSNGIGRITTGGTITEYAIPGTTGGGKQPLGIASGPDGAIWFTMYGTSQIGRIAIQSSSPLAPRGRTREPLGKQPPVRHG